MTKIPDLHNGEWRRWNGTPVYQDFALYHIAWKHNVFEQRQLPFYPFFWRDPQGYIYFPSFGENWIWGCELNAAIESGIPLDITVYEGWEFVPYSDDKPFAFIEHYYQQRSEIKRRIKSGCANESDNGVSLVIKLGINSMYGKTAQKVGFDRETGTPPAYYNIAIAGWITAYTRATMFRAAWRAKEHIIAFATDGIFSTVPISGISDSNGLGGWETEELTALQIVQSGVYWIRNQKGEWSEHSRGFDRIDADTKEDEQRQIADHMRRVSDGWKKEERALPFVLKRFIAAKYASVSEERWHSRASWVQEEKELKLFDAGEKRDIPPGKRALHKSLYPTLPSYSPAVPYQFISMSEKCRAPWDGENASGMHQAEDNETLVID
jgi:hypothetical protein